MNEYLAEGALDGFFEARNIRPVCFYDDPHAMIGEDVARAIFEFVALEALGRSNPGPLKVDVPSIPLLPAVQVKEHSKSRLHPILVARLCVHEVQLRAAREMWEAAQ